MKRKLISLLLVLSMLVSAFSVLPVYAEDAGETPYVEGEETSAEPVGEGTVGDPYRIYTKEQLLAFSSKLADNPAACAKLMQDIVYNASLTLEANTDTGLIRVDADGKSAYLGTGVKGSGLSGTDSSFDTEASVIGAWYEYDGEKYSSTDAPFAFAEYTPMASAEKPYIGTFDGAGYAIVGAWCTEADSYAGIFAYIGEGATVNNLTVKNSLFMTKSGNCAGAVAGYMHVKTATNALISNCKNEGSAVVANNNAAGILGYQNAEANMQNYAVVSDCVNTGDVMARASNAAGIMAGSTRGSVNSSAYGKTANYGTVYSVGDYAAGITTTLVNGNSITNCFNAGSILAGGKYAAGIASASNRGVSRCVNVGEVTAKTYASGIISRHNENNAVQYCANLGKVAADTYAAGITVGVHGNKRAPQISHCYNAGEITARVRAAGIICEAVYLEWTESDTVKTVSTTVKYCYSTDTAHAIEIDADAICTYFDEKAPDAVGCEIITKHEVENGALACRFSGVMCQNLAEDEYPTPTANNDYTVYCNTSYDGYIFYSNSKTATHRTHLNEDGDCYCDECEYTYPEKHVNEDGDCYCDICNEADVTSHSFTSGGLCRVCGEMKDGVSALCLANLSISSGIKLGLFMKLDYAASINPAAYAEITVGKDKYQIKVSDAARSGEYFVFYVNVPAKYLSTDITVQMCGLNIGKGEKYSYSVKKYLEKLDVTSPSLADLTEAIRLWGGAAQEVGGVNKDDLLNDGLTYPDNDGIVAQIPTDKTFTTSGGIEGLALNGKPSITLTDSFTVRFTFKGVDGVKFYYCGKEIPTTALPLEKFAVDVKGIPASDIASDVTLVAKRGDEVFTVSYSILDEIVKNYNGGNKSDAYLRLFYSVLKFAQSANVSGGNVQFNMNGGTIENETLVFDGNSDVGLPTEGMSYVIGGNEQRFLGWYSDPELTNRITVIPAGTVGTVNVYAKWDFDFFSEKFDEDRVISESGETATDGNAEYCYPEQSGAKFEVKDGRLVWTAVAGGSSVFAESSTGAMLDNLTGDGYISYAITLSDVGMSTVFGLAVGERIFEFFRTAEDGKVYFLDTEILPDGDGLFEIYLVLDLRASLVSLYGKDEKEIATRRLSVEYSSSMNILIRSSLHELGDGVLKILSESAGAISIGGIDVLRGHIFKKNAIDYNLGGATVLDPDSLPLVYNTSGEPTKLPSGDILSKSNHFFAGWFADEDCTVPISEISIYSIGIIPVYAKWNMIFLDVDYDREDAVDPDAFERTGGGSGNGLSYGIYGGKGTYKVFEDDFGEKYLLAATEKSGSQITGSSANKFSNITSSDLSISFVITLGANGYDLFRRPERDENGGFREFTDLIDESNLANTYLRLRAGGTDMLYVFNVSADGKVTMGGEEIARIDLDSSEPITLRIVADFKNGNLINYDENGNILKTVKFTLKNATTYEQMLRLLTGECFCMRLNNDNSAFRLYDVKIVESNVLGN